MCQAFHLGNVQAPISAKAKEKERLKKGTDSTLDNTPFLHRLMSCTNEIGQSSHLDDAISRAADQIYLRCNCVVTTSLIVAASIVSCALPVNALTTFTSAFQHTNEQHGFINTVSTNSFWVLESTIPHSVINSVHLDLFSTERGAHMTSATPILESHANPVKKIGSQFHPQVSSKVIKQTAKLPPLPQPLAIQTPTQREKKMPIDGQFKPIDADKITNENQIEVELELKDRSGTVKIDRETFQKIKTAQPQFLQYLPSSMQPLIKRQFKSLQVLKEIPDDQLFEASVLAGSLTEIIRSTLTYPLGTVKARVQSRRSRNTGRTGKRSPLRKLRITWLTFVYETKQGNLFAGILPTLLVTIPASGIYSGVKEVSKRAIAMGMQSQILSNLFSGDGDYVKILSVNLLSALVADVASLAIRTPADILGKYNRISIMTIRHNHSVLT